MKSNLQLAMETIAAGEPDDRFLTMVSESIKELEALDEYVVDFMVTQSLRETASNMTNISAESLSAVDGKTELSAEDFSDFLDTAGKKLHKLAETTIKNIGFQFSFFDGQVKKLENNLRRIENLKSSHNVHISLKDSRYLSYAGGKRIANLAEYSNQTKVTFDVLKNTLSATSNLMKDVRFINVKTNLSFLPVAFDVWGWFRKNFGFFLDFAETAIKSTHLKKSDTRGRVDVYSSPTILGNIEVLVNKPKLFDDPDHIKRSDLASMFKEFDFTINTEIYTPRGTLNISGVNAKELKNILNNALGAADEFEKLNTLTNKLFSALNDGDAQYMTAYAAMGGIIPMGIGYMVSARIRAHIKIKTTLYSIVGMIYYATKNNYNEVNRVVEASIRELH